ncbi:MAG: cobalamin-dependent protein [Planctomycetota bacterium]|nr:cobalamin-dependent protein [Planctomycetota bacterium]
MSVDLVLLHPPSVYDFRQKTILHGPVSDLVPSTNVFEMYPIGFASIAEYLERAGYRVRVVNLAVHMLNDRKFDAEKMIRRLKAPVFGIDLHWLVSAHGAIEVAKIVKRCHPDAKVVMGGLSATYFHRELIRYPEVDFVVRGDSTEEPVRRLMDCLKKRSPLDTAPNLVWKDDSAAAKKSCHSELGSESPCPSVKEMPRPRSGHDGREDFPVESNDGRDEVRENPFSHVPVDLGDVMVDHLSNAVRSVIRYRDFAGYAPFKDWARYPITAVPTCRGCTRNCVFCGGSASAYKGFCGRDKTAFRSPQAVVHDVEQIRRFSRGPIFILGDLRQPGEEYAREVLRLFQEQRVKNQVILELFSPAPTELLRQMSRACPNFCLEISPESHDPEIRKAAGKHYSNHDLERTLGDALDAGCGRLDIFFIIGLPKQTPRSVMDTIEYCDSLLQKFKGAKRLSLFIGPLAPFLDPGSLGFEQPERHGYRILFRTLEEHRQALLAPSWKYTLNYETEWMTRDQIVETTYDAILCLNRLKAMHGTISARIAEAGEHRIKAAWAMMREIDDAMASGKYRESPQLKARIDRINAAPVADKLHLELPLGLVKLRYLRSLWSWATGR